MTTPGDFRASSLSSSSVPVLPVGPDQDAATGNTAETDLMGETAVVQSVLLAALANAIKMRRRKP